MKKLLAIALGLGIALGTVSFAQDTSQPKMDSKKSKKNKKKKASKTADDTKK